MIRANRMQALASIGQLQRTLEHLAYVPRRAAVIAAPKLTALIRKQFREGRDPYGRAWADLKPSTLQKHGPPPLTDSGQLRDGTEAVAMRANYAGIRLTLGARYGYFHQVGFRVGHIRVPARRIFPQHGLPAPWRQVLVAACKQAAREAKR